MRDFSKIQDKANAFMDKLLGSGVETTIIYKMFVSNIYDDSTGMNESVYSEYEIDSIKIDATLKAQLSSSITTAVSFGSGMIFYLIKQEDMPRTDVYDSNIIKDYISDNGEEKLVKMAIPLLKTFIQVQV